MKTTDGHLSNQVNVLKLTAIIQELQKFSDEIIILNPPLKDDSIISEFENKYGVILPMDYKAFLKHFDGIDLMGTQVLGFSEKYNIITV